MMKKKKAASKVRTVALERGLSILTAFKHDRAVLSLAELAATTRLYKSAILRYSTSLIDLGFLQRTSDGRYRLGPATFQIGRIYQRSFHRSAVVLPILRDLVAETGESAAFYIRDGESDVCLYRIESPHPVRDAGVNEGDRFPLDDSACSTVLSAFSSDESVFEKARTDVLVVARHSVRFPGVSAIACPVFAFDQKLAGAFLLSGPETRFSDAVVAKMRRTVAQHAAALTRNLGGNSDAFRNFLAAPANETSEI